MDTISTVTILNRGVRYLTNHPDHLSKRVALAHVLVDARVVRSVEAGILAFKIWATPGADKHPVETIIAIANEKAQE